MNLDADGLRERLREFDRAVELLFPDRSFRLVFVGGGAMVLLGFLERATSDLDALRFPPELLGLMERYDLSGRVTAWADCFAYNYEDRLVRLDVGTTAVECYSASLEDLVASKLYSDRPTDYSDVRRPEVLGALDWNLLATAIEEMRGSRLIDRRYREMLANYEACAKECKTCDS